MSELWAAVELMEGEPIVFVGVHADLLLRLFGNSGGE